MADFDYSKALATAQRLITRFGRDVTLRQLNATPPDPLVPFLPPTNPRAAPAASLTVRSVFVDPVSAKSLGLDATVTDWVARSHQIGITAAVDDAKKYGEMLDGAETWRVLGISSLRPGPTLLLHFWGVAR